jgi:hypothetical protein
VKKTIAAGALGIVDRTEKTPVPTGKTDVFRMVAFLVVLQETIRERVAFQRKKLQETKGERALRATTCCCAAMTLTASGHVFAN